MGKALLGIVLPTLVSALIVVVAVLVPPSQRDFWLDLLALLVALTLGVIVLVLYLGVRHLLSRTLKLLRRSTYDALVLRADAPAPPAPAPTPTENRTSFKDETVRLAFSTGPFEPPPRLHLRPLCDRGARDVVDGDHTVIAHNGLDATGRDADDFFMTVRDGSRIPPGALVLVRCTFIQGCEFQRVSFIGFRETIRFLREGFGLPPDPPEPNRAERRRRQ